MRIILYIMNRLTGFQRDLMYIINGFENPTEKQIKQEMDSYYNEDIFQSRIYHNIDILINYGYVDKIQSKKFSRRYSITKEGRESIASREQWTQKNNS